MALFTRNTDDNSHASQQRWLQRPVANAVFDGAQFIDRYAVLRWGTDRGGIAFVHSMVDGNAAPKSVTSALRRHHGARLADRYACVVVAQTSTQVSQPWVPDLQAYDVDGGDQPYYTTWAELAARLGQPAPYWFHALRDRDTIAAWRPGTPPAVVPAHDIATPVTALTELVGLGQVHS